MYVTPATGAKELGDDLTSKELNQITLGTTRHGISSSPFSVSSPIWKSRSLTGTMAAISSIRTSGDEIEIVDQLLLPHTQEWIKIDTIEEAYEAIKSMKVG